MVSMLREWVGEPDDSYAQKALPTDSSGIQFRIVRGAPSPAEDVRLLRCSARYFLHPESMARDVGFRCVMDPMPKEN